jgi:hypothetical protein
MISRDLLYPDHPFTIPQREVGGMIGVRREREREEESTDCKAAEAHREEKGTGRVSSSFVQLFFHSVQTKNHI